MASKWTATAIFVVIIGLFLLADFLWYSAVGFRRVTDLRCPAPLNVWLLLQFVLLLSVIIFYLWDHFMYYRSEMHGRWKEEPQGSHGIMPMGTAFAVFWTLSEFCIAVFGSFVVGFNKTCLNDVQGYVDGWAFIAKTSYWVSAIVWVIIHWTIFCGLVLLTCCHYMKETPDQTLRYGAAPGGARSEKRFLIPQRNPESSRP